MTRLGVVFDIVLDLSAFCEAEADDAACLAAINEGHVVETIALWDEANHAKFVVLEALVYPDKGFIPGEFFSKGQRQAMRREVCSVFGWIEGDAHALV